MIGLAWWAWLTIGVGVWLVLVALALAFFAGACRDLPPSAGGEDREPW